MSAAATSGRELAEVPLRARRPAPCEHHCFHSSTTQYDRRAGVLRFLLTCDRCGTEVREVTRITYRPQFAPYRNPPLAA